MSVATEIKALFGNVAFQRWDMHAYQEMAVQFLLENPFSALFVDMGLGKTVSSLTVIAQLVLNLLETKVLVIAPLKVATDTWPTEIAAWGHTAWLSHTLLRVEDDHPDLIACKERTKRSAREEGLGAEDTAKLVKRMETHERWKVMRKLAHASTSIHIVNRENVEWLVNLHAEKWPYRVVFIDESSSFKDHNSDRFKALAKVRRTEGLIERLHLLTATPAAEGYVGLFPQMYLLDRGARLGKNITAYRRRYLEFNKYSHKYTTRPGAEEEILGKIADICLVMKREDYLPREEPTIIHHKVKLAPQQLALMKELERHFVMTLPDGTEIEAKSAAMLASMLLQMASGSVYETVLVEDYETDDLKKVKKVHHIHDHKIETLREIVEEAATQGENLLVAYHYQSSLAKLTKAFPKAVVMDKAGKCIKRWNEGKIPLMFLHPQNAGHGLNLQKGGSTLIFYDLIYSLENYLQIIGRIDRQGQTKPVLIQMLIAEGTRDELVAAALAGKEDAQAMFFRLMKRLIARYRKEKAAASQRELVEEI